MDLVEVNPMAKPPVCKIMDYGKFKYEEKKRASEAKKKQVVVHLKEIKLRPKTEEHDYEFKVRNVRRFLEEGNKAKVTIMFRGREMAHPERGEMILNRLAEELEDLAVVEQRPQQDGRNMTMMLAPQRAAQG
jgi:translation initiation factor IF-3